MGVGDLHRRITAHQTLGPPGRRGETFALAAALGRMPREVMVHAVEGADFGLGYGLTPSVAAVLPELTRRVTQAVEDARHRLQRRDR